MVRGGLMMGLEFPISVPIIEKYYVVKKYKEPMKNEIKITEKSFLHDLTKRSLHSFELSKIEF